MAPLTIATTTSVVDSGLSGKLTAAFNAYTNNAYVPITWKKLGSGAAMEAARNGQADLVIAHDRIGEMIFWGERFALVRNHVFYNYFVIVGPTAPKNTIIPQYSTLEYGFTQIYANLSNITYVSRGNSGLSGTWIREQQIWKLLGLTPPASEPSPGPGIVIGGGGDGMMATLNFTNNLLENSSNPPAYTLTDIGTWYAFDKATNFNSNLMMLTSPNDYLNPPDDPARDPLASNQYVGMPVNPNACFETAPLQPINTDGAFAFLHWLHTSSGPNNARDVINTYKPDDAHQGFIYNACSEHFPDNECLIKPIPDPFEE